MEISKDRSVTPLQGFLTINPDGDHILQELLQNAVDAGVKEVAFLYDEQSYGTYFPLKKEFEDFQDSALSGSNTVVISEKDLKECKGIHEIFDKGHYDRTLFRFPLSQKESKSEISQLVYDEDRVKSLFDSFKLDANMVLLFLKNLEKVEFYTEKPELKFRVQIHEKCLNKFRAAQKEVWKCKAVENMFLMTVEMTIWQYSNVTKKEVNSWAVYQNYRNGKLSTQLKVFEDKHGLPLQWPLDGSSAARLPYHVNCYFDMDQNRHRWKWTILEQTVDLIWNRYLLQEALLGAFHDQIEVFLQRLQGNKAAKTLNVCDPRMNAASHIYSTVTSLNSTNRKWQDALRILYGILLQVKMFHTSNNQWVQWSEAVFNLLGQRGVDSVTQSVVLKVTNAANRGTVAVPEHVMQGFKKYFSTNIKEIDANLVRECLLEVKDNISFTKEECLSLLQYIGPQYVEGLKLLPLADGTVTTFKKPPLDENAVEYLVYIPTPEFPQSLVPNFEHLFVDPNIPVDMKKILENIAMEDTTQLKIFCKDHVTSLIPKVLPKEWKSKSLVDWNTSEKGQPTEEWMEEIWHFLKEFYPEDLSEFQGLHLIPKMEGGKKQLIKIDKHLPLILKEWNGTILPQQIETVISKVGGYVLPCLIGYLDKHKGMARYVHISHTARDLLEVFSSLLKENESNFISRFENLCTEEKKAVREFLIKNDDVKKLKDSEEILKKLPLFETMKTPVQDSKFVSVDQVKIAAPQDGRLDVKTPHQLLDLLEEDAFDFAAILDIKPMSELEFFEEIVLKHIEDLEQNDKEMFIKNALLQNDSGLDKLLREYPCIPVCPDGETLKRPTQLINPKGEAASLYSLEDGRFPYEPPKGYDQVDFNSSDLTSALGRIGMVQSDIPWDDVVERCKSVKTLSLQDAFKRSDTLLHYMQWKLDHCHNIDDPCVQDAKTAIIATEFLFIEKQPSDYPYPWKGNSFKERKLFAPNEVYLLNNMSLLGSIHPIVNVSVFPQSKMTVPKFLQLLDKKIPIEEVLKQLDLVTEWASDTQDGRVTKHTGVTLQRTCGDIYSYLESQCRESYDFSTLSQERIILANDYFMTPERCTFKLGFKSCTPYLFEIKQSQRSAFGNLYEAVGVRETIRTEIFFKVLCELKEKKRGIPIDCREMDMVLNILSNLAFLLPELQNLSEIEKEFGMLYIPDEDGIMQSAQEMCYSPAELIWVERKDDMIFTHPKITPTMAEKLGIKTIRKHLTKRWSKSMPCEQKDGLDYLRNLLTDYPCNFRILKELLQNADDAGATEIHFVIDARYHNAEKLMSDEWEQLQGPALLVYNNKPFTQNDLEGIQSLGEGSKGDDPTKTGQYGVGFNCVYHLTDVPTFMTTVEGTGTVLCAFDPHCRYVPGADQDVPGQMFEDRLTDDFPDAFAPFMQEHFDIEHGTVFRFPLRTAQMAQQSKLVTKDNTKLTQNPEVLKEMLMEFKSEMTHCLLFLSNVKTIKISEVEEGKMKHIYSVKSALFPAEKNIPTTFSRHERIQAKRVKDGDIKVIELPYQDVSYRLEVETSDEKKESWLITKCMGFMGNEGINDDLKEALDRGDLGLLPRGAIATKFNCQEKSSRLFCFLPLPVQTSLPVHVNGHFALNSDNRCDLWSAEGKGYRTTWNTLLFTNTLARAYASLLLYMKNYILSGNLQDQLPWFYNLFPSTEEQTSLYLKGFVKMFYQTISRHEKYQAVLPVIRGTQKVMQWYPPCGTQNERAFFDNLQEQISERNWAVLRKGESKKEIQKSPEHEIIRDILDGTGFNLLHAPMEIYEKFKEAGIEVNVVSPRAVLKFFLGVEKGTSSCCLGALPQKVNDTPLATVANVVKLLKYCKGAEKFFCSLSGLPLMVLQDETLNKFSDMDKKFLTHSSKELVPEKPSLFLHSEMLSVFSDDDIFKSTNVFKRFTPTDLAVLLKHVGGVAQSNGNPYKVWHPEEKEGPRKYWFFYLWKYLLHEAEALLGKKLRIENEEQRQQLNELLEPLSTWNILPAVKETQNQRQHLLIPLKEAFLVADLNQGEPATLQLRTILKKVGIPVPDFVIMHLYKKRNTTVSMRGSERLVRLIVGSLETPDRLIMALKKMLDISGKLETTEAMDILKYITENLAVIQKVPDHIETLQKLPFYPTVAGEIVPVHKKNVSVLPAIIPTDGIDVLVKASFVTYLKDEEDLQDLYEYIGCNEKSLAEIYSDFVSNFKLLSDEAQMIHLQYLSSKFESLKEQEKEALSKKLKTCNFLKDSKKEWKSPSEFYDPENAVFKAMEADNLLPTEYAVILPFLRKVGLIHEVTTALFVDYCRVVEADAKITTNEKLASKAKTLLHHLFGREDLIGSGVLSQIRTIHFIPPTRVEENLNKLYKQYGMHEDTTLPYFSFEGSVFPTSCVTTCDARLVWTNTAILSSEADPSAHANEKEGSQEDINSIIEALGASSMPHIEKLVDHVTLLCNYFATRMGTMGSDEKQTFQDTMECIYSYLDHHPIPENLRVSLQGIPMVLVDKEERLVKIGQIATEPKQWADIHPYLFNIQPTFKDLFEKLGATKDFTPEQYSFVLKSLHEESEGEILKTDQIDIAKRAIYGLFFSMYQNPQRCITNVDNIYLLCTYSGNHKLVSICDLVWIDDPSLEERLKASGKPLMVPLKECDVPEITCESFFTNMSQNLRLKTLTVLLEEHSDEKETQPSSDIIDRLIDPFKGLCFGRKRSEE